MRPSPDIQHDVSNRCFELNIDTATAHLDYHLDGRVMTIHHTFVPVELRGQNIAGRLAKAAFDHARSKGLSIIPHCAYIARYAERFPEARSLILQGSTNNQHATDV